MSQIDNLDAVADALEAGGYEVQQLEGSVSTAVGGADAPFVAVLTINEERNELVINCQVATLGDIPDKNVAEFAIACLDANSRIRPFAFATLTATDNPALDNPDKWPIVLTDSVPLGDLSDTELQAAMDNLWAALVSGADVLRIGIDG